MKKITESKLLDNIVMISPEDDKTDKAFKYLFSALPFWFVSFMILAIYGESVNASALILLWSLVATAMGPLLVSMSRFHVLWNVRNVTGSGRYDYVPLRKRAKEYISLSAEDRALYPSNILTVLKNEDLTFEQADALDKQLRTVYALVERRNKARELLERRHVDISDVMEHLSYAQREVEIEADTYEEYAIKE